MKRIRTILYVFTLFIVFNANAQEIEVAKSPDVEPTFTTGNEVAEFPDEEPTFATGTDGLRKFMSENVEYPDKALANGDQGRVFVEFIVGKDGKIEEKSIKVLRGVSPEIDAEAIRLIRLMPKWKPGRQNDKPVRARCRLPMSFMLT